MPPFRHDVTPQVSGDSVKVKSLAPHVQDASNWTSTPKMDVALVFARSPFSVTTSSLVQPKSTDIDNIYMNAFPV